MIFDSPACNINFILSKNLPQISVWNHLERVFKTLRKELIQNGKRTKARQ
jgi:hypothetical protein